MEFSAIFYTWESLMKLRTLLFLLFCFTSFSSFAQQTDTAQKFMATRGEILKTIYKEHEVIETKDKLFSRLLLKRSAKGEEYGKYGRIYYFTEEGHFAHPSIMIVQLVEKEGNLYIDRRGLSGADKSIFEKWIIDSRKLDRSDAADIMGNNSQKTQTQFFDAPKEFVDILLKQSYSYFAAKDKNDPQSAYAFYDKASMAVIPFSHWITQLTSFNKISGKVISREIKKITWYKNPQGAPEGVYGAADFESKFENINIHCGFLVWRVNADQSFSLIREEDGYIDKNAEKKIDPSQINTVKRDQLKCRT